MPPPSRAARPGCTWWCGWPASVRATRSSRRPISFVASANALLYERATPVFADVDPDTFILDPAAVEAAVTPRTRGILPVHVFGLPVRHGGARRDRREARAGDHRGRREAVAPRVPRPARRRHRQPGGVRLLPEQADDHGRGRHGHDRRPRARRAACARSPTRAAPTRATGSSTTGSASTTAWTSSRPPSAWRRPSGSRRSSPRARRRGALRRAARAARGRHDAGRRRRATCARGSSTSCGSTSASTATP